MAFVNIDAPGNRHNRHAVAAIQRNHGAEDRKAAAQARRDLRAAKRASPEAILFYPWPVDGVVVEDRDGAYAQGPNGDGQYQVVVIGPLKGTHEDYCAAVSKWVGLKLSVSNMFPMLEPTDEARRNCPSQRDDGRPIEELQAAYAARGPFLSIILDPVTVKPALAYLGPVLAIVFVLAVIALARGLS